MKITVAEILDALIELVNERQPLGIERPTYQHALQLLARIDDLENTAIDRRKEIDGADLWQLVPTTATKAMINAFWRDADCSPNQWRFSASYRAMLEAAPKQLVVGIDRASGRDLVAVRHG